MFETRIYIVEINTLKPYRTATFNTFTKAEDFADRYAAVELEEYENSSEFKETGEYNPFDLYYEVVGI